MFLCEGDSAVTLKAKATATWVKAAGAKADAGKPCGKVKLFVADRPFNVLKKNGAPLLFDNMLPEEANRIAGAEVALAHPRCRFLSRVSNSTDIIWRVAYKEQNLHQQQDLNVHRLSSTCRGPRFVKGRSSGTYR